MVSVNVSPHTYSHTPCYLYFNSFFYYISLKVQGIIRVVNFMWTLSVSLFFKNTPFPGLSSSLSQVEVIFNVFLYFRLMDVVILVSVRTFLLISLTFYHPYFYYV